MNFDDFPASKITVTIDEYVHSTRDREVMRRRLIDGETYQEIADAMNLAPRTIRAICSRHRGRIFKHL